MTKTKISNTQLHSFMKSFRRHLQKSYTDEYTTGKIYSGEGTITYFPFTPEVLKGQKLKIAIVFNQNEERFEIWLAGQNKQIQQKYWKIFKESDWSKYHMPDSIENHFSIVDEVLVETPNFNKPETLIEEIETNAMKFVKDIVAVFEE